MTERVLGIIPARGGSKGIPRKNLVQILGRPLLQYTVEGARGAKTLGRAVVTSEDEEVLRVAAALGVETVRRPVALAQDDTPTEPVMLHVLDELYQTDGYKPALVVLLQPTSPARHSGTIDACVDMVLRDGFDSVLTVAPDHSLAWTLEGGDAVPLYNYRQRPRRQELRRYRETGSVYVTREELFRSEGNRLGGRIGLYVTDDSESIDVDSQHDLLVAEHILGRTVCQ